MIRKVPYLKVVRDPRDNKLVAVDSNTYQIRGIREDDYLQMLAGKVGYAGELHLDVDVYKSKADNDILKTKLLQMIEDSTGWSMYLRPEHPTIESWFTNLADTLIDRLPVLDLDPVFDQWRGKTVIFCGAGPSLKKNRKIIEEVIYKNSAIVIAGGAALRIFHKWGLSPHYCMAIDPFETEYSSIFKHLTDDWMSRQTLLSSLVLNPGCLRRWTGRVVLNGGLQALDLFNYLDELPHVPQGTVGVSTAITMLCKEAKVKRLIMCGVDLAFEWDAELVQYADGPGLVLGKDEKPVSITLDDKEYYTRPIWLKERKWLSFYKDMYNMRIERLPTDGLPIEGIPVIDPKAVSNLPKKVFKELPEAKPLDEEDICGRAEAVLKHLKDLDVSELGGSHVLFPIIFRPYLLLQQAIFLRGGEFNWDLIDHVRRYYISKLTNIAQIKEYHVR